jgi:hypothetical protein
MNRLVLRAAGIVLILAAILGLIASAAGLYFVWRIAGQAVQTLTGPLDLADRTLRATSDLLTTADQTLSEVDVNVRLVQSSLADTSIALKTTAQVTSSTASMLGQNLASVVTNTQTALTSVQSSARLVDDSLRIITMLPLIGARYAPQMTLEASISSVTSSLNSVPKSLGEMQEGLNKTASDLSAVQTGLDKMATSIGDTLKQLAQARQVMAQYLQIVGEVTGALTNLRQNLPAWVNLAAWGATVLLVWLIITQLAVLIQGLDMLRRKE